MSDRNQWIDNAKAIGIILVVYGHVARGLSNAGLVLPSGIHTLVDSVLYSFHIPLFFFLSGLFFYSTLQKKGAANLMAGKVDTLIYPYLLWSLLQGGIEVALSRFTNGNVSWQEVLSLWQPRAQFWFLYALFVVFLVATVIFSLLSVRFLLPVWIASILIYVSCAMLPTTFVLAVITNHLVFFVSGIVFHAYVNDEYFRKSWVLAALFIAFLASQYTFHSALELHYLDKGGYSLVLAWISIGFVIALAYSPLLSRNRIVGLIGASSLAIYLTHILIASGVRVVLQKFAHVDSVPIHLLAGCIAGIVLPLMLLWGIRRFQVPYVFSAPLAHTFRTMFSRVAPPLRD